MSWIEELEYRIHRIPREDLMIYLDVPPSVGRKLIKTRGERRYAEGQKDIHEKNLKYLSEVEKVYLALIKKKKKWVRIKCVDRRGKIYAIPKIHIEIKKVILDNLNI